MSRSHRGIRALLLVPIALLVLLALASAAALGVAYGEKASNELVGQLVAESAEGLRNHLRRFLGQAQAVNGVNAEAMRQGAIDADSLLSRPEPWFLGQHKLFDSVDDIYFGSSDGAIAGVDKSDGGLVVKVTTAFPQRSFFPLDPQGMRGPASKTENYDATQRNWYRKAVAAGRAVWSDVYVLQNKQALGLTAAQPALDRSGRLAGVMGANLTLESISAYLERHPIEGQTASYIVESGGQLVAASVLGMPLSRLVGGAMQRLRAQDADHAAVAESYRAVLAARTGATDSATPFRPIDMRIGDMRQLVYVSPFKDALGLDWQIVTVVEPSGYLAAVRAMARTTLSIGAVLLLLLLALVVVVTGRLARPIEALSRAADRMAQGEPGDIVSDVGGGREVRGLVASFNNMSQKLGAAMAHIRAHADQLEAEVAQRTAELRTANQALAQAHEQALAASVAKTNFLAHFSHEIRTPLSTIAGTCHLMLGEPLSPEQNRRLLTMEAANQHVLGMVNAVLDISKIEAGRLELDDGPVWIEAVVGNVVSMLLPAAQAKHLSLHTRVAPMPASLLGDATRLQQMLINLAGNAVKFTEKGSVAVNVSLLEDRAAEALIEFEVSDSGQSFATEAYAGLFQPFEQGASTDAVQRRAGTGLGLAITRQIAQKMGGNASGHSRPEGGNSFRFWVWLKKGPAAAAVPTPASRQGAEALLRHEFAGARVLVVEDDPVNQTITLAMLHRAGLAADAAASGAEAVQRAATEPYELILMDMQMADTDGLSATRQIRQQPLHVKTPIIALTANAFAEDRHRCLQAGMDDYLTKPVDAREFFGRIRSWLARRRAAAERDRGAI